MKRLRFWNITLPLALAFGLSLLVRPMPAEELPAEVLEAANALPVDFDTPHTKWAKPYAQGPLRVLFFAQMNTDVNVGPTRYAVELMRRFDLEGDAVLVVDNGAYGDAEALDKAFAEVRKIVTFPEEWSFRFDAEEEGLSEAWHKQSSFEDWGKIRIDQHWTMQGEERRGVGWYATGFEMPQTDGTALMICFGAVDGYCDIFIDGRKVGEQTIAPVTMWDHPFYIPLDNGLTPGHHVMAIRVKKDSHNAGIWKPIWIVGKSELVLPPRRTAYGGEAGRQRLTRLLHNDYDCYVSSGPVFSFLPESARSVILQRVKSGAGLALLSAEGDEEILASAQVLKDMPDLLQGPKTKAYLLGKGRVVRAVGPPIPDLRHSNAAKERFGWAVRNDWHYEALGGAILWAAKREPPLKLSLGGLPARIPYSQVSKHRLTVTCGGSDQQNSFRLQARVRSLDRGPFSLYPTNQGQPSSGQQVFSLPSLPAGTYSVEVFARSKRGMGGWTMGELTVTTTEQVENLELQQDWGEVGEHITGTVAVKDLPGQGRSLRIQAVDKYGRVLEYQDIADPQGTVGFSLPIRPWMPSVVWVEAVLRAGEDEVSHTSAFFTIPHRRQDDWNFVLWGVLYGASHLLPQVEETLARCGVTARIETSSVPWWYMTAAGMAYVPYCSSGLQRQHWTQEGRQDSIALDTNGVLEGGCWNDEPAVTQRLREWLGAENDYRRHGVLAYDMGDENETLGSCLHPTCWQAYLDYLKEQYGSIAALNESWGTSFKEFGEIQPIIDETALPWITEPEGRSTQLKTYANNELSSLQAPPGSTAWSEEMKNYPRWFDRKAFQATNFANYCRRFGQAAEEIDPRALAGPEGTGWLDDDLDAIVRHTDWWILYSIPASEVVRSIAPPGYLYGHWVGYSNTNPKYALSDFWLSFLRGANCIGWWRVDNFLGPHYGPSLGSRELVESAQVVFDGLGELLNIKSQTQHDGIAMLHSFASSQASSLEAGPSYGTYSGWMTNSESESAKGVDWALKPGGKNHMVWHRAIRALGLQFEYVTDRMMRLDEFRPDQYKVMILSQCEAIGLQQAELIREFVANGGTVIADVRPGLFDDHCKPLAGGALDDVFGVRHTGNVAALKTDGIIRGEIGGRRVATRISGLDVNPAVQLTTGKAAGEAGQTPLVIRNQVGAGQAILLNFAMCSFPNLSIPKTHEAKADLLSAIFASAGVQWPLRLLDEDGNRRRNVEAVRWQTGNLEVVAIYGPLDDGRAQWRPREGLLDRVGAADVPKPVRIQLAQARYVTEIGSGREAGPTKEFTVHIRPWRPVFVVLSDQKLRSPVLTLPQRAVGPGQLLRVGLHIPDAQGLHALKLRVTTPDDQPAAWFNRSVMVGPGGAELALPLAHNDQLGQWTVQVTDLYTDRSMLARFQVR